MTGLCWVALIYTNLEYRLALANVCGILHYKSVLFDKLACDSFIIEGRVVLAASVLPCAKDSASWK